MLLRWPLLPLGSAMCQWSMTFVLIFAVAGGAWDGGGRTLRRIWVFADTLEGLYDFELLYSVFGVAMLIQVLRSYDVPGGSHCCDDSGVFCSELYKFHCGVFGVEISNWKKCAKCLMAVQGAKAEDRFDPSKVEV